MGEVFGSNGNITATDGSRVVWSNTRRPVLLLTSSAVTLTSFDIAFPDLAKSNFYGFHSGTDPFGFQFTACLSGVSLNPQEWDSGLSFVCNLPAGSNYFETEITLSRIVTPSPYLDTAIPDVFGSGSRHMPDGNAAIVEAIGPIIRMFSFERSGNAVYLRRKQSVTDAGQQVPWRPGNNAEAVGWTYGGNPNAWPAYRIQAKNGGSIWKRRGQENACSLADPTNYASTWRGTVTITPGYIAP